MVVREDERMWIQWQNLHRLTALAGDWIGAEKAQIHYQLHALDCLNHGVDLAEMDGPAERPAGAPVASAHRAEASMPRVDNRFLQPRRADFGLCPDPRHDPQA